MNQKTRKKLQERIANQLMYLIDEGIKQETAWNAAMIHADIAIETVMEYLTPKK